MFSIITTSNTPEMMNDNLSPAITTIEGGENKALKKQHLDVRKQDPFVK